MGPTFSLAATTMFVAVTIAIAMGVLAAWKAGSLLDRVVMGTMDMETAFGHVASLLDGWGWCAARGNRRARC
jgi:ABC-type dipeptide/oligopeptide/nickel transport system permease subunit